MTDHQQRMQPQPPRSFVRLEEEVAQSLLRRAEQMDRAMSELLRPHDLTPVQYGVLHALRGAGSAGLPAGEVGARMATRVPDATRLIDRLERQGRVRRERPPNDRRVVMVRITEAGRRTLAELDLPVTALYRRQLGHLGAHRLAELLHLLEGVRPSG